MPDAALVPWVDAAFGPSLTQAQEAHAQGHRAVGFYLPAMPGEDPYNAWTPAQVDVARQAGLTPVPIIVPAPGLTEDPSTAAASALERCAHYGLTPTVSVLYSGNHLEVTGQIAGPVWLPIPGPAPTSVGAGSAIQYGQTDIAGWSVDLNLAAPDFPFDRCVVVDFEHAVGVPPTGLDWYRTFQAHFHPTPAPPDPPLPPSTPGKDSDMIILASEGQPTLFCVGGHSIPLDQDSLTALAGAGVPIAHLTLPVYQQVVAKLS